MSKLYEAVHAVLARGPRSTEEIVAECRRAGYACRPETVELFLRLSRETAEREGIWSRKLGSKTERILAGLQQAFAGGQTYLPMDRLNRFLDDEEPVTGDEIAAACQESGRFKVQGNLVLRI